MKERGLSHADNQEPRMLYLGAAYPKDKCYIVLRNVYVLRTCILLGDEGQQPEWRERQKQR